MGHAGWGTSLPLTVGFSPFVFKADATIGKARVACNECKCKQRRKLILRLLMKAKKDYKTCRILMLPIMLSLKTKEDGNSINVLVKWYSLIQRSVCIQHEASTQRLGSGVTAAASQTAIDPATHIANNRQHAL